ncbi:GNAT family N-acetyltransferase [uncultured Roseibium sp.]|uniref:GNAT family N-acetyltransferase n=1 Tax=uncultured Roseibium sp. TaxID=1936171 RepID=UPI00260E280A|nr:GNAT family N-acetyltransferase [uncultured Roseibium sp.]
MTLVLQKHNFEAFFEAPFSAYGSTSHYVSPMKLDLKRFLSTKENPLFGADDELTFFTAHRNGKVLGRITAHVHTASNEAHGWNRAYFGYFDCANDQEAARALLGAAEDWARLRGHEEIMGNFNLTAMQQIGVQTAMFDAQPYTDLVYSPPHIAELLRENGYSAEFPMTTFELDLSKAEPPAIGTKQQAIIDNPDFRFVPVTRSNVAERMEDARLILNASFANNPMFVPVSREEFHFQARDMKWIMDPRISAVLYHRDKPAACIICVPDLNPFLRKTRSRFGITSLFHFVRHKVTCKRAVLIFSGVIPELQGQGVNPVVLHRVILAMKQAGYEKLGNTWIGDSNKASLAQKEKSHAEPLHKLHLFKKALS